jgi:hypothetical protein
MERICRECGEKLGQRLTGTLCLSCQEVELERISSGVDALVDVNELAEMLRCHPETIRRNNRAGELPDPIPHRKNLLWSREVISAWIKAGCPDVTTWRRSNNLIKAMMMGYQIDVLTVNGNYFDTLDDLVRQWEGKPVSPAYRNPFG